jgi:hypothetical protein
MVGLIAGIENFDNAFLRAETCRPVKTKYDMNDVTSNGNE